jgi:hypothetical protein
MDDDPGQHEWYRTTGHSRLGASAIVVATVVLVYGNTFNVPFYLDDIPSIVDNPNIKDLGNLQALWIASKTRVVAYLTFALNFAVHGLDVRGYHLVNTLVHGCTGIAVYALAKMLLLTPAPRR